MKIAACIGSYYLPQFVELNIKALRHSFGGDIPILVSDDPSPASPQVEQIASRNKCEYIGANGRRGHFSGDIQAYINGLKFAEHIEADIMLKISQRVLIVSPVIRSKVEEHFSQPELDVLIPGRPRRERILGHKGYSAYPFLTDVAAIRASAMPATEFMEAYRHKVRTGTDKHDCFVEFFFAHLLGARFPGRHAVFNELTDHQPGPRLYLRRYQNSPRDYMEVARRFGIYGQLPLGEWNQLQAKDRYLCKPVCV